MNRAERRRLEKQGVSTGTVMQHYRNEAREEGFQAGMRRVEEVMFYMTAYTLQYKLNFGRKRLQDIMYYIFNNIDGFRTGHLTPEDFQVIKQEMQEKYGVRLS